LTAAAPGGLPTPRIDVVIVGYESREAVLEAVRSVKRDTSPLACIRVVDNASLDGTAEAVRAAFPDVDVIANEWNRGFAAACNQGWRAGNAPLVLFLNPDAELQPGALAAMAGVLDQPAVGIVGPRTLNADGSVQVSTGPDLSPLTEPVQRWLVRGVAARRRAAIARAAARHARRFEPGWVSGSCLMARRSCLEAISGFDEGFFLYEEDADLCRRARAAGFRVVFTPDAVVRHALGRSMARAPARARIEYHRSHLRYYERHLGRAAVTTLRALLLARAALAWGAGLLRGRAAREAAADLAAAALGRPRARRS
jgi:N-acetylglucosaminyl-diphospho-decaprenol L-rhamnosyltransferase